jgi:DNA-binding SARP family transcriptional activator
VPGKFEVRLLCGIEATQDNDHVPIAGVGLKALVAILSLAVPHPVSSDHLIDELWGDEQPKNPENALQARISELRRLFGRASVIRREPGYALVVEPEAVDALRLERFVRDGREAYDSGDEQRAGDCYRSALSLVHGPPLSELLDFRFALVAASRIEEMVLAAHEGLADVRLALGQHTDAVDSLIELVRAHPLRERFHAQLMLAFYRCGRQADALRTYKAARDVLLDELGLEPGPELKSLEHSVLSHDPGLTNGVARVPTMPQPISLPDQRDLEAWRTARQTDGKPTTGPIHLVGREYELHALQEDLAETIMGRGRLVLLGGEPGIGKTRLAEELGSRAKATGAEVVWGRCYEGRGAPAFWPWTQIVNGLLTRTTNCATRSAPMLRNSPRSHRRSKNTPQRFTRSHRSNPRPPGSGSFKQSPDSSNVSPLVTPSSS